MILTGRLSCTRVGNWRLFTATFDSASTEIVGDGKIRMTRLYDNGWLSSEKHFILHEIQENQKIEYFGSMTEEELFQESCCTEVQYDIELLAKVQRMLYLFAMKEPACGHCEPFEVHHEIHR